MRRTLFLADLVIVAAVVVTVVVFAVFVAVAVFRNAIFVAAILCVVLFVLITFHYKSPSLKTEERTRLKNCARLFAYAFERQMKLDVALFGFA